VTVTSAEHYRFVGDQRAHIIPCGVDLNLFRLGDKRDARLQLGLPTDDKLVLYCGGFRPEKRIPLIEESVEHLKKTLPNVTLVKAIGRPHNEIPLWMRAADALVLVSDYEGSPVVIKEAMAMNLPIVATAVGDIPERFSALSGHYLVRQNVAEIADALMLAVAHGPTMGRNAIAPLSLESTTQEIIELYRSVL
jgi:glycosyltransferase involved in cell wall biosynthesis